jgi:type I restriction enzyme M protein
MDITTLENWLWEAACSIRGPLDASKYKDYILPLLFYKRLCNVLDDELARLLALNLERAEADFTTARGQ